MSLLRAAMFFATFSAGSFPDPAFSGGPVRTQDESDH